MVFLCPTGGCKACCVHIAFLFRRGAAWKTNTDLRFFLLLKNNDAHERWKSQSLKIIQSKRRGRKHVPFVKQSKPNDAYEPPYILCPTGGLMGFMVHCKCDALISTYISRPCVLLLFLDVVLDDLLLGGPLPDVLGATLLQERLALLNSNNACHCSDGDATMCRTTDVYITCRETATYISLCANVLLCLQYRSTLQKKTCILKQTNGARRVGSNTCDLSTNNFKYYGIGWEQCFFLTGMLPSLQLGC